MNWFGAALEPCCGGQAQRLREVLVVLAGAIQLGDETIPLGAQIADVFPEGGHEEVNFAVARLGEAPEFGRLAGEVLADMTIKGRWTPKSHRQSPKERPSSAGCWS